MSQAWAVNDVAEMVIEGTNEGMPWAIVRHYLLTVVSNPAGFDGGFVAEASTIMSALDNLLTDQWQAECVSISRVAPQPRNVFFESFTGPVIGDVTTDGVANQTAVLIKLSSDVVGARGRGRVFICGCPEASTDGGLLSVDVKAAWDAAAATFAANCDGAFGTAVPCIFSRTAYGPGPGHPAEVADYTAPITSAVVVGTLATQRRRRYRRNAFGPPA